MNRHSPALGLGIASAAIVPSLLIGSLTPGARLDLGLGCALFGWRGLMVVHLIAASPIGLIAAAGLVRSIGPGRRRASGAACVLLGLAGAWAVASGGEGAARALEWCDAGFAARAIIRTILASLLVLPWLVAALLADGPGPRIPAGPASLLVGATLAILPPWAYASRLVEARSAELNVNLGSGRLLKAKGLLLGLSELGSRGQVAGTSPMRARRSIEMAISRLERDAGRALPGSAGSSSRLGRAYLLIQLERLDEAESMLRPLSETSTDALLLLGAVHRDRARWAEAERTYRRALASLLPDTARDPEARERIATAFDGLAEAARSAGHPEVAERAYEEARRHLPAKVGYFLFQLGRHYLGGGRPSEALARLHQAIQLDPTLEAQARPLILQARVRTPACLLRPPGR